MYTVQQGDTLSGIALKFYGDHQKSHLILDANPHLRWQMLIVGQKIKLPEGR